MRNLNGKLSFCVLLPLTPQLLLLRSFLKMPVNKFFFVMRWKIGYFYFLSFAFIDCQLPTRARERVLVNPIIYCWLSFTLLNFSLECLKTIIMMKCPFRYDEKIQKNFFISPFKLTMKLCSVVEDRNFVKEAYEKCKVIVLFRKVILEREND